MLEIIKHRKINIFLLVKNAIFKVGAWAGLGKGGVQ